MNSFTETLINKVKDSKTAVQAKLFKEWCNSKDSADRDVIYAKMSVLDDLTFTITKQIRDEYK